MDSTRTLPETVQAVEADSLPRTGTRITRSTVWGLSPVIVLLVLSLCCWAIGHGVPYGYDAIEVYFTYLVGYNAAHFASVNPLMADIAASPDPAAHPYYYTHHPNLFADLVTQGLIRIGLTDLAFNTLVAIAISLIGLWFARKVLSDMLGERVGTISALILALHYNGVITWSTNILRSFHFPLFWISLYLLQRYMATFRFRSLLLVALAIFAVFLNDYTLGPFVLLLGLFLIWLARTPWTNKVAFTAASSVAACVAIGCWLTVLSFTLDRDTVIQDIVYTYLGRNASEGLSHTSVLNFYQQHNIVFWNAFVPTNDRLGLTLDSFNDAFTLGHGALAPLIYAAIFVVMLGSLWSRIAGWMPIASSFMPLLKARSALVLAAVSAGLIMALVATRPPESFLDWSPWPVLLLAGPVVVVAVGGVTVNVLANYLRKRGNTRLPIRVPGLVRLDLQLSHSVSTNGVAHRSSSGSGSTSLALAFISHVQNYLDGTWSARQQPSITLRSYTVSMALTIAVMSVVAIGAFTANFVSTYKPSLAFVEDVVLAVLLVSAVDTARHFKVAWFTRAVLVLAIVGVAGYWLLYQFRLAQRFPPTELEAAAALRSQAFQGQSFVAPDMHAVVWYYTRGTSQSIMFPSPGQSFDFDMLMFFQDHARYPDYYRHPEFLACVRQHVQAAESIPCAGWESALKSQGYLVSPGFNELLDQNMLVFRFPAADQPAGAELTP